MGTLDIVDTGSEIKATTFGSLMTVEYLELHWQGQNVCLCLEWNPGVGQLQFLLTDVSSKAMLPSMK